MDAMYASYYTREVMVVLVREFQTPDEEMKKIVLKVVEQCVGTEGVEPVYIRTVRVQSWNPQISAFVDTQVCPARAAMRSCSTRTTHLGRLIAQRPCPCRTRYI
jgi:hypothetical protein